MRIKLRFFAPLAFLVAVALAASSCAGAGAGINLTDQKQIDTKLVSKLIKQIDPEASVLQIDMVPGTNGFSKRVGNAMVTFVAPGSDKVKCLAVYLTGNYDPRDWTVDHDLRERKADTGLKISEIDFSQIASNLLQAEAAVKEAGDDFSGIGIYSIELDGDPAKVLHEFSLQSKAKDQSEAGRDEILYLSYDFAADAKGELFYDAE